MGVLVQTWAAQFHFSNLGFAQKTDKKEKRNVIQQISTAQSQREVCIHAGKVDYYSRFSTSLYKKKTLVVKYFMQ